MEGWRAFFKKSSIPGAASRLSIGSTGFALLLTGHIVTAERSEGCDYVTRIDALNH